MEKQNRTINALHEIDDIRVVGSLKAIAEINLHGEIVSPFIVDRGALPTVEEYLCLPCGMNLADMEEVNDHLKTALPVRDATNTKISHASGGDNEPRSNG